MTMRIGDFWDGATWRKMGCLPTAPALLAEFQSLGLLVNLMPRAQWEARDGRHLVRRIFDQGYVGSCASEATVQAVEICRAVAGMKNTFLSPGNLYGRVNDGFDDGSSLGDNLREITERGVCTEELVGHTDWRNWNTDGWKAQGKKHRAIEVYRIGKGSFDGCISAVLHGFPVVFGVLTGGNFAPDGDGWLPDYSSGYGGHAMVGLGVGNRGGTWGLQVCNSWGEGWGLGGWCYMPESYFKTYSEDAFAIRAVVHPRNDGL